MNRSIQLMPLMGERPYAFTLRQRMFNSQMDHQLLVS